MAGDFLTAIYEGDSIAALQRFHGSGDIKELAIVNRNAIFIQQIARDKADVERVRQESDIRHMEQSMEDDRRLEDARNHAVLQVRRDRELAISFTEESRRLGTSSKDSDEKVNDFLNSF